MKKYLIRQVAWVYDDSHYLHDGLRGIVNEFADKAEAEDWLRYLEREYLVSHFNLIHRYEVWGGSYVKALQQRDAFATFLVEEMDFNPSLLLFNPSNGYSLSMFHKVPGNNELDKIVEKSKIKFFNIVEVDDSGGGFVKAKMNFEKGIFRQEYLMDYDGMGPLFFSSKRAAMERFKKWRLGYLTSPLVKRFQKPLSELSKLPEIFKAFVTSSAYLDYKENKLVINDEIDVDALLKLNALLAKPFLVFEEVEVAEGNLSGESHVGSVESRNFYDWLAVEERLNRFGSVEALKRSKDYLSAYQFEIHFFEKDSVLKSIIQNKISDIVGKGVEGRYGCLRVGGKEYRFNGVVLNYRKGGDTHWVEAQFGFHYYILWESEVGKGEGATLMQAFESSLGDWLAKNQAVLMEKFA